MADKALADKDHAGAGRWLKTAGDSVDGAAAWTGRSPSGPQAEAWDQMHALQEKIRTSANWSYDEAKRGVGYLAHRSNTLASRCEEFAALSRLREHQCRSTDLIVIDLVFLTHHGEWRMKEPSLFWLMGIAAMLGLFSSCALFRPTSHISVKAVSWKLVKKYAEPEAGLVGHKITIIDPSDGRVVAEKLTDNLGYAIFDVPAGRYTVEGIGSEPQNVDVSPGQTVGFKLIVH